MKNHSEAAFKAWMSKVDAHVEAACGLSSSDLPDICYRELFEDGVSPKSAARQALSE